MYFKFLTNGHTRTNIRTHLLTSARTPPTHTPTHTYALQELNSDFKQPVKENSAIRILFMRCLSEVAK